MRKERNMKNKLLELIFQPEMWEQMIAKMNDEKGLDKTLLRKLCDPEVRGKKKRK